MLSFHYSRILVSSSIFLFSLGALGGQTKQANAINITFDYSLDTNKFFDNPGSDQRLRLDEAASYFEGFSDQLSSLGSTTYNNMPNPAGSGTVNVTTAVGQDEIKIFVGGNPNLSSLGEGGSFFGSQNRGQSGSPTTDFAPLIGFMSFDSDANWHFGDKNNAPPQNSSDNDFLSVALHELSHVMGFGIASSWDNFVNEPSSGVFEFTGSNSVNSFGQNIPLPTATCTDTMGTSDPNDDTTFPCARGHWDFGVESTVINSGTSNDGMMQEAAMDPDLLTGSRKFLTELDYASLEDIGWEVNTANVPFEFSPSLGIFFIAGMFGTKKVWNARKIKQPAVK